MKKVLVIAYTDLSRDPRPLRQIKSLCKDYTVHTVGEAKSGLEGHFYQLRKVNFYYHIFRLLFLLTRRYESYLWDSFKKTLLGDIKKVRYDLIIVHEIRLVPFAKAIDPSVPVILDAHEYSPHNFNDNFMWKLLFKNYYTFLCEKYLSQCSKVITVTNGVGELYKKNYGVDCVIITNAAEYHNIPPSAVDPENIKIIHHGDCSSSRKLELTILMMDYLPENYTLNLMLVTTKVNEPYKKKLMKLAQNRKVVFIEPVKFREIIPFINQFDIGITFHPPTNINILNGLGNKFFEFVQARLIVAVGPLPEMKNMVLKYNLGIVSDDFLPETMANKINEFSSKELENMKIKVNDSALLLSSENNDKIFRELVKSILK